MDLKNDRYTYRITWSESDKEYVGLCAEFPSLSWLAPTPEDALQGIRRIVAEAVADMQNTGETPPAPYSEKNYSGKFVVRVPQEIHRRLAMRAAEARMSLNRLVNFKLTEADEDLLRRLKEGHLQAKKGQGRINE